MNIDKLNNWANALISNIYKHQKLNEEIIDKKKLFFLLMFKNKKLKDIEMKDNKIATKTHVIWNTFTNFNFKKKESNKLIAGLK